MRLRHISASNTAMARSSIHWNTHASCSAAAEIPDQREVTLHLASRGARPLGEEGLRKHRHPVKECLPALGTEGVQR